MSSNKRRNSLLSGLTSHNPPETGDATAVDLSKIDFSLLNEKREEGASSNPAVADRTGGGEKGKGFGSAALSATSPLQSMETFDEQAISEMISLVHVGPYVSMVDSLVDYLQKKGLKKANRNSVMRSLMYRSLLIDLQAVSLPIPEKAAEHMELINSYVAEPSSFIFTSKDSELLKPRKMARKGPKKVK